MIDRTESELIRREAANRDKRPNKALPPRRAPKKLEARYRHAR